MKPFGNKSDIRQRGTGGMKMLPLLLLLFAALSYGRVSGIPVSPNTASVAGYRLEVSKASATFLVPYRNLTAGNCFRIVSRDPARWSWEGRSKYDGTLPAGSAANGYFEGIPLPADQTPGEYEFDIMVGFASGGTTCYSEAIALTIRVVAVNGGSELAVCSGEQVVYTPECLAAGQSQRDKYRWTRAAVPGIREAATAGDGGIVEVLTNTTSHSLKVRYVYLAVADECSGEGSFEVVVTVKPRITFEVVNRTPELCEGQLTDIGVHSEEGLDFQWKTEQNGVTGADNGTGREIRQQLSYEGLPGTVVYRILPLAESCSEEQTTTVKVKALPEITLDGLQAGGDVMVGHPISIAAWPETYKKYLFRFNDKTIEQAGNVLTRYEWRMAEQNEVAVTVASAEGCENTAETQIFGPDVLLPNAFTPNGDGINDKLMEGFEIEVFNPNGGQLYKGKDGWDGRYRGTLVPDGTYFYVVKCKAPDDTPVEYKFHVCVKTGYK